MKLHTKIGIACSIFLVLNYLILSPCIGLGYLPVELVGLLNFYSLFIFPFLFLGFYFSLYSILKLSPNKKISEPLKIVSIIAAFILLTGFISLLGINIPSFFSPLLNFFVLIVSLIWIIRVLRNISIDIIENLLLKRFATVLLIGHIVVFIATFASVAIRVFVIDYMYNPFAIMDFSLVVYGVAYIYGFIYFFRINKHLTAVKS